MDNNVTAQAPIKENGKAPLLRSECHLHLYGCLDLKTLWEVSEHRSCLYPEKFQWFLNEYFQHTGLELNPAEWWSKGDNGFKLFKSQIAVLSASSFEKFQAKFNLLIALFPPQHNDMTLAKSVFLNDQKLGGYKEYRTFLPLYLSLDDRERYLKNLVLTARGIETSNYHPRLAISIVRQDQDALASYDFICQFLLKNPDLAPWITGVDFCGNEANHPPINKQNLFQKIIKDNTQRKYPLGILYHVGEMWTTIALHSAARWCVEAAQLGSGRLGHAMALGLNPQLLAGQKILEQVDEWHRQLQWMQTNFAPLTDFGFDSEKIKKLENIASNNLRGNFIEWNYDEALLQLTEKFQEALLQMTKILNPVVESCLTSNLRIGGIVDPTFHPLKKFLSHNLKVTLSTDDPGLFDISLADEELLASSVFNMPDKEINAANNLTESLFNP